MESGKLTYFGETNKGKVREKNEDNLMLQPIWDENHLLLVVADGVGGYAGGDVASRMAVESILSYLLEYSQGERPALLKQAVTHANNLIFEQKNIRDDYPKMSCVLTACIIDFEKAEIHIVHIGDTRLYIYKNGELIKLSHDHSLIGYREESGELSEEEAMNHPQRNLIYRDLGSKWHQIDDEDFLDAQTFPLEKGATYLLCSDGLSDMLTTAEIIKLLSADTKVDEKVKNLINAANSKGGKDNITVILVENEGVEQLVEEPEEPIEQLNEVQGNDRKSNYFCKTGFLLTGLILGFLLGWFLKEFFTPGEEPSKGEKIVRVSKDSLNVFMPESKLDSVFGETHYLYRYKKQNDTVELIFKERNEYFFKDLKFDNE